MRISTCFMLVLVLTLGAACGEAAELLSTDTTFENELDSSTLSSFDEELANSCIRAGLFADLNAFAGGDIDAFYDVYDDVGDELTELCTLAIENGSGLPIVYLTRGRVYRYSNQHNRAIDDFTEAIRLYPEYDRAYRTRAQVYIEKAQYGLAIDDLTKAMEYDPDSEATVISLILRGAAYVEIGSYRNALDDANKAIYLDPDNTHAYRLREEARRHFQ